MQFSEISHLTTLLRNNGDQLLDASTKLTLSHTLLHKVNESLLQLLSNRLDEEHHNFTNLNAGEEYLDLQYLYDFIQKTLALKLLPDYASYDNSFIDIQLFKNLRLLEVHRLSSNLIRGLRYVRSQLEYITCSMQSVSALGDVLEYCGGDKQRGDVWNQLTAATFSHNSIEDIDRSVEFTPGLKSLDLSHNCIRSAYLINCLPNLLNLNLGSNRLETFPRFTGPICSQLKVLNLRNNLIESLYELTVLVRLEDLDLSFNCLLDHKSLLPLSSLASLKSLTLQGNPLSYHSNHRRLTAAYLHINVTSTGFILDDSKLSQIEARQIGAFLFLEPTSPLNLTNNSPGHDSAISSSSSTTIPSGRVAVKVDVHRSQTATSDIEPDSDDSSISGQNQSASVQTVIENLLQHQQVVLDQGCMQDSGFEPGPGRVASPSDSIGSASSLNDLQSKLSVIHCDSDIEILSNPSQSSIEVLSFGPHMSNTTMPAVRSPISTNNQKLKKRRNKEAHRSL